MFRAFVPFWTPVRAVAVRSFFFSRSPSLVDPRDPRRRRNTPSPARAWLGQRREVAFYCSDARGAEPAKKTHHTE
jgi:hypothetical protein